MTSLVEFQSKRKPFVDFCYIFLSLFLCLTNLSPFNFYKFLSLLLHLVKLCTLNTPFAQQFEESMEISVTIKLWKGDFFSYWVVNFYVIDCIQLKMDWLLGRIWNHETFSYYFLFLLLISSSRRTLIFLL